MDILGPRLEQAIRDERDALAVESRNMLSGVPGSYRTAHDLAHLHRYALVILLAVKGDVIEPLDLPCDADHIGCSP